MVGSSPRVNVSKRMASRGYSCVWIEVSSSQGHFNPNVSVLRGHITFAPIFHGCHERNTDVEREIMLSGFEAGRKANPAVSGKAGMGPWFEIGHHCHGGPEPALSFLNSMKPPSKCPKCGAKMEEGFILEHRKAARWIAGPAETSVLGDIKAAGK